MKKEGRDFSLVKFHRGFFVENVKGFFLSVKIGGTFPPVDENRGKDFSSVNMGGMDFFSVTFHRGEFFVEKKDYICQLQT